MLNSILSSLRLNHALAELLNGIPRAKESMRHWGQRVIATTPFASTLTRQVWRLTRVCNMALRLHIQLVTHNHWLVTQRINMRKHALERHSAAVRQLSNGTNGVNSPIWIWVLLLTKLRFEPDTATYRQHKVVRPWLGSNLECISQHTTESAHYPLYQQDMCSTRYKMNIQTFHMSIHKQIWVNTYKTFYVYN